MLTHLGLSNFKCFRNLELDLAPITLLCGLNGMGKSSVIQALLVLRQSYERRWLRESGLVLSDRLADIGTGRDALFEGAETDAIEFSLRRDDVPEPCVLTYDYDRSADRLNMRKSEAAPDRYDGFGFPDSWIDAPLFEGRLFYVHAERLGPRKSHALSETFARGGDIGARGEFALNYLHAHGSDVHAKNDPRFEGCEFYSLEAGVERWLGEVSPDVHLRMEEIRAADALVAGFTFDRKGDVETQRYRATNVGFGLSYVLPLLVAMFAPAGSLCLVENPEAHMHPRGQTKLAELAVRATKAGVQTIVETHSDHFMDGVRIAVRDGLIAPSDVAFYYFERGNDGAAAVSSPQIDRDGRLSEWPAGFFRPARRESRPSSGSGVVTMRYMVLNHASLRAGDLHAFTRFLRDVAIGMKRLKDEGLVEYALRTARYWTDTLCAPGVSLYDVMQRLRREGARDEYNFLISMTTKAPFSNDVDANVEHRFLTSETIGLPPEGGDPLLYCALTRAVAVGFPTSEEWDRDKIRVDFDELQPDEITFNRETEEIDHLARAAHAGPILDRDRKWNREQIRSAADLWRNRGRDFPYLAFGPDVEAHLRDVPRLHIVIKRLTELNDAAKRCCQEGGPAPQWWTCKVADESDSVKRNPRLKARRLFRSASGGKEYFFLHVRIDRGWRIHLRIDAKRCKVEIGYIGPHLPLS